MKSNSDFQRYFLAIIPPQPVYDDAQVLKEYFRDNFNSKASLNSPPHITLHMPFRWKEKKETLLIEKLNEFSAKQPTFTLSLDRFGAFAPRVIYLNVQANQQLLTFQKELERYCKISFQLFNANRLEQPYRPHLTLAFRDLKKEAFDQAWNTVSHQDFKQDWVVDSFYLLKSDGYVWHAFSQIFLQKTIK
ncbi:MAG: 2'-5' RNA ligase family protein [Cytophagia bacterium]|nr:2'-5' RNA ligase family protein [Cytophagia bacterium]